MNKSIVERLKNSLIVSCQAFEGEPLFGDMVMTRMAAAAINGGANIIRTNGVRDVKQIKESLKVLVIGLNKRHLEGYDVYITPTSEDAIAILEAGADIIAIDCTSRKRPEPLESIFENVRTRFPGALILADIACVEDAEAIEQLAPDFLATTLSGYTENTMDRSRPDTELVNLLTKKFDIPVVAEGNYWQPEDVVKAFKEGAFAVTVGSAISRPHLITERFARALNEWLADSKKSEG